MFALEKPLNEGDYIEQYLDLFLLIWQSKKTGKFGWQIRKQYYGVENNEAITWCEASHSSFKSALIQARGQLLLKLDIPD